ANGYRRSAIGYRLAAIGRMPIADSRSPITAIELQRQLVAGAHDDVAVVILAQQLGHVAVVGVRAALRDPALVRIQIAIVVPERTQWPRLVAARVPAVVQVRLSDRQARHFDFLLA